MNPAPVRARPPSPPPAGRARIELGMAGAAVAVRALLLAASLARGESWRHLLGMSYGGSFLAFARVIYRLAPASSLSLYDMRVFPGWPVLFGWLLRLGLPEVSMLVATVALAALVPVWFYRLTGERALAWCLVAFPPAWLSAGVAPMSEPAYLAIMLGGLLALKRERPVLAGLAGGALIAIRPFGVVWAAALILAPAWRERRLAGRTILAALAAALPILGMLALNQAIYGDPWRQLHVVAQPLGQLNISPALAARLHDPAGHWGWPFQHLLLTPWLTPIPWLKVAYIYAHVPVLLLLGWETVRFARTAATAEPWQIALVAGFAGNALLILCTGPYWGFASFDRYFVWGLPGALWLARRWLGRPSAWPWLLLPLSVGIALRSLLVH